MNPVIAQAIRNLKEQRHARWQADPATFAGEALHFTPDAWQARALSWTGSRALWNCARQSGKSQIAAMLAAHTALYRAKSLTLLVSPSERQSRELFRKVIDLFDLLSVRGSFVEDNRLSAQLVNGSRIVSLPGSEKTIRGYSAVDLLVLDEAARVPDDLYTAVRPMLAVSGGRLIGLSTPFGQRGWFFEEWTNGGDAWERIEVKATDCPRIPPEFLQQERCSMGDLFYRSEYECEFVNVEGSVFDYDSILAAMSGDVKPLFEAQPIEIAAEALTPLVVPLYGEG